MKRKLGCGINKQKTSCQKRWQFLALLLAAISMVPFANPTAVCANAATGHKPIVLPNVDPVLGMDSFEQKSQNDSERRSPSGLQEDTGISEEKEEAEQPQPDPNEIQRFVGADEVLPITGYGPASYADLDKAVCDLLRKHDVPGGSVCIAIKGKIILAKGYGYADVHKRIPVQPDTLFRIASVSKGLTSVAIAKLIEEHKLNMDDKVFKILHYPWPSGTYRDPRLDQITIKNLLEMTGGWERRWQGDPLFSPFCKEAAEKFNPSLRPTPEAIIRYWIEQKPLNFDPGRHFAYSNFGYTLLGQVIEKVTGRDYEEYIKNEILAPCGITEMRVGKTCELAPKESVHYPFVGQETTTSIFPNYKGDVPLNYGGNFCLEAMKADTGWIASSPDLVRFLSALYNESGHSPISQASWQELLEWPDDVVDWKKPTVTVFFAKGWQIVPKNPFHLPVVYREGCLAGSVSVLMHRADGVTFAFSINSRPVDYRKCQLAICNAIWKLVNKQLGTKVDPPKKVDPWAEFKKQHPNIPVSNETTAKNRAVSGSSKNK